jgi:SRSO17 transposase
MPSVEETAGWDARFGELAQRLAPRFGRKDLRRRAEGYLRGLLGRVERKNSWQLAEAAGDATPHGLQRLLGRARWDADAVRDDLRAYVVEHLGEPDGVLIVDETGFLKKGTQSAGVARQYSGTAGRIENSQVGVFLAYRSGRGAAFLDRALYLPAAWADDRPRRAAAGVPEAVAFATKPEMARTMLRRALHAGVPARWVTADEVYGSDSKFRRLVEGAGLSYVVAVTSAQRLFLGGSYGRVDAFADDLPERAWRRLSCGAGSKGQRLYDWALVEFASPPEEEMIKGLLVRRSITDPSERAYYLCRFPRGTAPEELVRVAGCRWAIESAFEQTKQEVGLDDYEVRGWDGWHRHITLALFAHAFLEVVRSAASAWTPPKSAASPRSSR